VLLAELGKFGQQYATARLAYSVDYLRRTPALQPGFTVTPQMVADFYAALVREGVKVDRAVYDAATRWLADDLGYEITYSKWGEQTARQRLNRQDPQVIVAAQLLQKAANPASLFKLATDYAATHKQPEPQPDELH
jgi:hypothetical protein